MTKELHILGLFPEILKAYFHESLLGKASEKNLIAFFYHNLRDHGLGKNRTVDDKPYGGGPGMVFRSDVVCQAVRAVKAVHAIDRVVLTSPSGELFTAKKARQLSDCRSLLFLCGRYEGVDQRAIDLVVDEEISIGDYVLSGGEIAAGVMIDAICRYVPGVVGKSDSVLNDSHEEGTLEHPHYTRPLVFENMAVPDVLRGGDHKEIQAWRRLESLKKTWRRRPELLKHAGLSKEELKYIRELIHARV